MSETACPFCFPAADRIFHLGEHVLGLWDGFPVADGHALLVTRRHVATWFEATVGERQELIAALDVARAEVEKKHAPDGFNIGVNVGEAAGQTIAHLHVHLIPRYAGDVDDPRGGVRHVIPARGNYLAGGGEVHGSPSVADQTGGAAGADLSGALTGRGGLPAETLAAGLLVAGDRDDPLLPHLLQHLTTATGFDLAVAFVQTSGVARLREHLRDFLRRGGRARIVTGDYLDITDPDALRALLDLAGEVDLTATGEATEESSAEVQRRGGSLEIRIFESSGQSFHPKSYIFRVAGGDGVAYVGSSNLSKTALEEGIEWNYRVVPAADRAGFRSVEDAFERLFAHPHTVPLDGNWVAAYDERRPLVERRPSDVEPEPPADVPEPHRIQREALAALSATRKEGNRSGLVVLATGLGKTWLAAFDTASDPSFQRVLFVAHREEILGQALATFRRIRPRAHLGFYTGQEKAPDADVLFASVQTLSRKAHLERFSPEDFDYIVIDEFHHAAARTYRKILDYFRPGFLLGLTATPERTDGGDLLALCGENLVYRCQLGRGIEEELLSPFSYFGVPDVVDYDNIPWRSTRFDPEELEHALATEARAENALEQWREKAGPGSRTLAFCCSKRHADYMAEFFRARGVKVVSVHSGESSAPRAASLEELEAGRIEVVFAVDLFNEGVDIPNIDAVLMLRPTESRILWLQQFGRGLRRAPGKERLTVVDYIGNHRVFLNKPMALLDVTGGDRGLKEAIDRLQAEEFELPPGCEVTYDLETVEILQGLLRLPRNDEGDALRDWYHEFRERTGTRPRALEAFHEGYNPRAARRNWGSWLGLVEKEGDLGPGAQAARTAAAGDFLGDLENTPMSRSYKMVLLLALLAEDVLPGEIPLDRLVDAFARVAGRSARLRADVSVPLEDRDALRRNLVENPINAWTGGGKTSGKKQNFFAFDGTTFRSTFEVPPEHREAFCELTRELVDWRLGEYLGRAGDATEERFRCPVRHSSGRPMLFLPDREKVPGLPSGVTPLRVDGAMYEADFVKVALNVVRAPGASENTLPSILRSWFGPDAGLPGTRFEVEFSRAADGTLEMKPVGHRDESEGLKIWRSYLRDQIPGVLGLETSSRHLQQGVVPIGDVYLLFVTLEKKDKPAEHRYEDRFLSPEEFQWQSQNRTPQSGSVAKALREPAQFGKTVHLFVRPKAKIGSATAPFVYCGQPQFISWEGEKPITFRWKIDPPVPDYLREKLGL